MRPFDAATVGAHLTGTRYRPRVNELGGGSIAVHGRRHRAALRFPSDMAYRIEATLAASNVLAAKPSLWKRVEEMLTGILETAEELRRAGQHIFSGIAHERMRVHVAGYLIWYVLDLERHSAKVLLIDRAAEPPEGSSNVG